MFRVNVSLTVGGSRKNVTKLSRDMAPGFTSMYTRQSYMENSDLCKPEGLGNKNAFQ